MYDRVQKIQNKGKTRGIVDQKEKQGSFSLWSYSKEKVFQVDRLATDGARC